MWIMACYMECLSVDSHSLFVHWMARSENYLLGLMAAGFYTISALCYVCSGLVCHTLSVPVMFCPFT